MALIDMLCNKICLYYIANIDSIHYLGLTNSYEFKFLFTSCAFPIGQSVLKRYLIGSFKSNRKLINFLSNELVSPRDVLNQYLRTDSIGTTVNLCTLSFTM
jgi:hypothetical protein